MQNVFLFVLVHILLLFITLYICFVATVEQSVGLSIRKTCLTNDENVPIAAMLRRISSKASISHVQSPWQPAKAPPREGDSELHSVFHKIRPIPKFLITRYLINPGCYAVAPVNICTFLQANNIRMQSVLGPYFVILVILIYPNPGAFQRKRQKKMGRKLSENSTFMLGNLLRIKKSFHQELLIEKDGEKKNTAEQISITVVPTGFLFPAVWEWLNGHRSCHGARTRMCSLRRGGDKLAPHP